MLATMATLILMVGLPGSGKTTLARRLETERPALRLTPDDWIVSILGKDLAQDKLNRVRGPVEAVQWDVAAQALRLGLNVILDFGFWTRKEREDFRSRAAALGASSEIYFLDIPRDELTRRMTRRREDLPPHTFHVTEEQLMAWSKKFERPSAEELELRNP